MLKERRAAAETVAKELFEAENAIEMALIRVASLAQRLGEARTDAKLSTMFGQEAIERVSGTYASLVQGRREIVGAHEELATVQRQIGLGAVAFGAVPKPDETMGPRSLQLAQAG